LYALPAKIDSLIAQSTIPKKDISIYIKSLDDDLLVASLNPHTSRVPASVMKLFTLYAIVNKLGFDYQIPTDFYIKGTIDNGVLDGDLIIKAYGDPTFTTKDLNEIVNVLKSKHINKITGDIIIDRSYFKVSSKNNSGFDEHKYSPYNAMPDAMMFNQRVSTICVIPNKNKAYAKNADKSIIIHDELKKVNKSCKGKYSWPYQKIDDSSTPTHIWLKGKISKRCGKRELREVVTKPYLSLFYALKDKLNSTGIKFDGKLQLSRVPKGAKFLYRHKSARLEKIVAITAKKSNNLLARHLMLILGAKVYGAPATLKKGEKAIKEILKQNHIQYSNILHIDNGCGLSRASRVDALTMHNLLEKAYKQYGKRWMKTLSIAGVDGTIKRRFRGSVVQNRAWMKTGTLKRVKNIAGYVKAKDGKLYSVVILVNSNRGNFRASALQNNIIKWLVTYKGNKSQHILDDAIKPEQNKQMDIGDEVFIQTGSFSQKPPQRYLERIKSLGYEYTLKNSSPIKVLVGPFTSKDDAKKELDRIKQEINSNAFIVSE
jgi:D-alanyl-D-alanine carboxypeptidase/D-alanyl-D-alanine-endopeptidase (penicillin-binding protein 4)